MITKKQLDTIERFADKLWSKVGLDIEFTRHFLDRLNDARNKKNITQAELTRLFKQSFKKYGNKISNLGADAQAVIKDMQTDINMPFVLQIDKNGELDLVAKTIMRKKDFKTTNQKFTVESGAGEEGTDALSYKYKKDTPGQSINGKNMKREKFVPSNITEEELEAFMAAVVEAGKKGETEFKFGNKVYEVTLDPVNPKAVKKKFVNRKDKDIDNDGDVDDSDKYLHKKRKAISKAVKNESEELDDIIAALVEASSTDYGKLSDDDLLDLLDIFKNVGRSAAKPVLKALQMELKRRNLKEEEEIEEADNRLVAHTPAAAKRLIKKLKNKFSGYAWDGRVKGDEIIYPNEPYIKRFIKKQPEVADMKEEVELEEADGWVAIFKGKKLEITKKDAKDLWGAKQFAINKLKVPKSKQGLLAIKPAYNESTELEEAKRMKYDKVIKKLRDGEWDTSMDVKKRMHLTYTDNNTGKEKVVFVESDELEEAKGVSTWYPKEFYNKNKNKYLVHFTAGREDSKVFDRSRSGLNSAYKYMEKQKDYAVLIFIDKSGKPEVLEKGSKTQVAESTELEEAKAPFATLEKDWLRVKGVDTPRANKARERLIKKYNLKPLISAVRPGSIKLGPLNDLKAKMGNHTIAGLDADGELIFVTNNPVKIYYPSNTKKRPEGEEMMSESVSLETLRLRKVVELSLGESIENVDSFIAEANIELTMTPSSIQKAYKKYVIERKGVPTYEIYHKSYSDAMQSAKSFAKGSGYEVDEDDWYNQVTTGPRKPSKDKVNRFSILLIKNGKEQKKRLQIQVTNLGTGGRPFELNAYIA